MMKKIIATALIAFASTGVMAKSEYKNIDLSQKKPGEMTNWELKSPFTAIVWISMDQQSRAFVLYVNKKTLSGLPSEPVFLNCNDQLSIVNPGTSTVCEYPAGSSAFMTVDQDFSKRTYNGAAGFIVDVEGKN